MKVSLVGYGQMGKIYAKKVTAMGGAVAVYDISLEQQALARMDGHVALERLTDAGAMPAIVTVNTPDHYQVLKQLIQNGCQYILCEKPLTLTLTQAKEIDVLARQKSVNIYTAFLMQFSGAFERLVSLMRERQLVLATGACAWGKNRLFDQRPSPGDLVDETVHGWDMLYSLALVNRQGQVPNRKVGAVQWHPTFVNDNSQRVAHSRDESFPLKPDAETMAVEELRFGDGSRVGMIYHTSFVWPNKRREVNVSLVDQMDTERPLYHACLELDTENGDRLVVYDLHQANPQGATAVLLDDFFRVDKIGVMTNAFLRMAFEAISDDRLTNVGRAMESIRFTEAVQTA